MSSPSTDIEIRGKKFNELCDAYVAAARKADILEHHRWGNKDARELIRSPDGEYYCQDINKLRQIVAVIDELAQKAGIDPPEIRLSETYASGAGYKRICISDDELYNYTFDSLRGSVAHELAHVINNDCLAEDQSLQAKREREFAADMLAGKLLGDPLLVVSALIEHARNHIRRAICYGVIYDKSNDILRSTVDILNKGDDEGEHPALRARIHALREQAKVMKPRIL